jgi:hypothetical protein
MGATTVQMICLYTFHVVPYSTYVSAEWIHKISTSFETTKSRIANIMCDVKIFLTFTSPNMVLL